MSFQDDQSYFAQRFEEEQRLGSSATSPEIAKIHFNMARRYAQLCAQDEADQPQQRSRRTSAA